MVNAAQPNPSSSCHPVGLNERLARNDFILSSSSSLEFASGSAVSEASVSREGGPFIVVVSGRDRSFNFLD
jgi:hypothetical protein